MQTSANNGSRRFAQKCHSTNPATVLGLSRHRDNGKTIDKNNEDFIVATDRVNLRPDIFCMDCRVSEEGRLIMGGSC